MIQKFQKAERIFIPVNSIKTETKNLKDFIIENFKVQYNELNKIYEFIHKDQELVNIIFELPNLIQNEVLYEKIELHLSDDFQEEILEVNVFSTLDIESILTIEDQFIHQLYQKYSEQSEDKI